MQWAGWLRLAGTRVRPSESLGRPGMMKVRAQWLARNTPVDCCSWGGTLALAGPPVGRTTKVRALRSNHMQRRHTLELFTAGVILQATRAAVAPTHFTIIADVLQSTVDAPRKTPE